MAQRFLYHLSLSDGRIMHHEGEGLFVKREEENILINSAVLLKVIEVDDASDGDLAEVDGALPVEVLNAPEEQVAPEGQTTLVEEVSAE